MFAVIEIQKNGATAAPITNLYDNKDEAYNRYHSILEDHSAILVSEEGNYMFREKFIHEGE